MNRTTASILRRGLFGVILASAIAIPAFASDDIYVEISGITGSSTAKGFEGDIQVSSISMGYSVPQGSSGSTGKPVFNPLVVSKRADKSTTAIMEAGGKGLVLKNVTLSMMPAVAGSGPTMRVTIPSAMVSDWRLVDSEGGEPTEQFTLLVNGYTVFYEETSSVTGAKSSTTATVP